MLKRTVSFLIALSMTLGFSTLTFASAEPAAAAAESNQNSTSASADAQSTGAETNSININGVSTINIHGTENADVIGARTMDGTRADGTLSSADSVTNVTENSSKYNNMQTNAPQDTMAPSRYSNVRLAIAPDLEGTKYEEAAELLGALGIMVGDAESGNFRPADPILRSEMAKVAVYAVGLEDVANNSTQPTRFPDVVANHWGNGAINVADQQGMIIGDDVGTFRPDDNVSFEEAVTMIVRALGYEPAAKANGGYPTGYMVVASSNQLLKGVNAAGSSPATRGDVAQLVFNAMTVNMMEQTGYGSDVNYEVVDKTLLYDKLNVEKGYGQIKGTSETTLTGGATTARDRIQINDNLFYAGETRAKQLLGYNVIYYARIDTTTDEKTLIVTREQPNKNNSITIPAKDIVDVTGDTASSITVSYWRSENDRDPKNVTIGKDPIYIYNGKFKDTVEITALKPTSGNLVLLDSDSNGTYDIVFVNHFKNIVVDTISTVTGRVTDKYLNGSLVFDPDNTNVEYSIIKDGVEIEVGDLAEWNVLSYTISDDEELIKAYVSDKSVTGTITEVNSKGFRISGDSGLYKKAESYPNEIALRDSGTFYIDVEGNIAAVNTRGGGDQTLSNESYAYLVNAAEEGNFETNVQFKLFTAKGETTILTSSTKMRLNKDYGLEPTTVLTRLQTDGKVTPQLITYDVNSSGRITGISIAEDATATGTPNPDEFTLNVNKKDMVYKSASGKLDNVSVTDETIVFDIPATADNDTDRFAVRGKSMFSNDAQYDALVYDMQENYAAKAIVITSSTGITSAESPIVVVDNVSETQNESFDYVDKLYGFENGKEVEINASDRNVLVKNGSTKLDQGDIIQYKTNARGEIDGITVLFDVTQKDTEAITELSTDLTTVYGRVTKKFAGSVNMEINGAIHNYTLPENMTVYLYDSARSNNNITVVSAADIEIYETGNEVRLFLKIFEDKVQEAVIVR